MKQTIKHVERANEIEKDRWKKRDVKESFGGVCRGGETEYVQREEQEEKKKQDSLSVISSWSRVLYIYLRKTCVKRKQVFPACDKDDALFGISIAPYETKEKTLWYLPLNSLKVIQ